jgi:hypothetical protein
MNPFLLFTTINPFVLVTSVFLLVSTIFLACALPDNDGPPKKKGDTGPLKTPPPPKKHPTGPLKTPPPPKKHPTGPLPVSASGTKPPTSTTSSGTKPPPTSTTSTTGTGGHPHMGLLPGQANTKGGVSNLLFGANIMNYAFSSFNSAAQANLKSVGVTVLRIPLADQSSNPLSDAALSGLVAGCKAAGAVMLGILPHQSEAFAQHAVSFLGNNCLLYELSNEPDLNNISAAAYAAMWNTWIPTLRKINPNAAFIGPVLGAVSNFGPYAVPFLKAVNAAGNLPDAVSFHDYPCGSQPTAAVCSTKAQNVGNDARSIQAQIVAAIGKPLPLAVTEWNVDWHSPVISYAQNAGYVNTWTIAALEGMASAGVVLANQFEQNGTTGGAGWFGGPPLQAEIQKYQAGAAPASGGLLAPIVSGIASGFSSAASALGFTDIFGGAGFVPIAGTSLTLAPNADVTALLQTLDGAMIIGNPFTENMGAIPTDTIGIPGVSTFTFTDPFSWIEQLGTNVFYDIGAALLRGLFLIVGTMTLIKVISEFIDFEAIGEAVGSAAQSAVGLAALV